MLKKIMKKMFYFMGSIKLAVPVLLILALVVAIGTVIESRYNAEYAKLLIYKNELFGALLCLIWLNVLFAALTRWPWKRYHLGFLITHLGLLLIFGGGFLTNNYGIDGMLRVVEGQSSKYVVLQSLVVSARSGTDSTAIEFEIPRYLFEKGESTFSTMNEGFKGLAVVRGYMPFADVKEVLKASASQETREPFEVQLRIKSAMFNVEQGLNSQTQNELQMGPALFRLLKASDLGRKPNSVEASVKDTGKASAKRTITAEPASGHALLNLKVGASEKHLDVKKAKDSTITIGNYKVKIKAVMSHAAVVNNGLRESPESKVNPALVVEITDGKETIKEVLFAKFPKFSVRKGKFSDLELSYSSAEVESSNDEVASHGTGAGANSESQSSAMEGSVSSSKPNGNEVRIYYSPTDSKRVLIQLWKAGKKAAEKYLAENETYQTPWMGMELTALKMSWNAEKEIQVTPTTPSEKMDQLPSSAVKVGRYDGAPSEDVWMPEGAERSFGIDGKEYFIYYGRKIIELPFAVELKSFSKIDYPGTRTPKEFESHVQVSGQFVPVTVSMNEPLHFKGYTLYQASYEPMPDGKFASVFSVNYDPGRPFKYAGGIVLALGIILLTLSKSRRMKEMGFRL